MATDEQWKRYTEATLAGELTGDAKYAIACRNTPLLSTAMLDLLWENLAYFGDAYYEPLSRPVEMRVEEYYESLKED